MTRRRASSPTQHQHGFSEDALWKKIAKLPARASSRLIHQALILYCLISDKNTPAWARALIAAALIYLINPIDAICDGVPVVGYADDAAAIALLLQRLAAYVTPALEARASKLVPWGNKATGDEAARPLNKKQPRNRKGKNEHGQVET